MLRLLFVLLAALLLTACEIDLNQNERSQGKLEELNGDIFFVAESGQVYQQIKNSMVELPFYSQKQLTEKKKFTIDGLAYLPLDIIFEWKVIGGQLYYRTVTRISYKDVAGKAFTKKIDASEKCPDDVSVVWSPSTVEKKFSIPLSYAELIETEGTETDKVCQNSDKYKLAYNQLVEVVTATVNYNILLERRMRTASVIIGPGKEALFRSVELTLGSDGFEIESVALSLGARTVSPEGKTDGFSSSGKKRVDVTALLSVDNLDYTWRANDELDKFKREIQLAEADIERAQNL